MLMVIDIIDAQLHTLDQLRAFLNGTAAVGFSVGANERCEFIARILRRFSVRTSTTCAGAAAISANADPSRPQKAVLALNSAASYIMPRVRHAGVALTC
jgi:hypothetical protein